MEPKAYAIAVLTAILCLTAYNMVEEYTMTDVQRATTACYYACSRDVESFSTLPDGSTSCVCTPTR